MERCKLSKKPNIAQIWLRCPEEILDRLKAIAKRDGVKVPSAVRQIIEFALPHFEDAKKK